MDGCCLLNIKWSSAAMIDFQLDPLMTLFFFHFLREFVCCLYKVVRNRKAEPISFFDLVAAVKKPQNAFASCRVLLRPSGLISFAFFHRRVEWIIFYDAIGFSLSSRCFQLALINELPVRPSVRWCGIKQQNRGGSFSFRVFVFAIFGILLFLRVRMRCISTSMNVTPSNFLSSDDCRARNFCRLPNRDGRWRRRWLNEAIGNHETDWEDSSRSKKDEKGVAVWLRSTVADFLFKSANAFDANERRRRRWAVKSVISTFVGVHSTRGGLLNRTTTTIQQQQQLTTSMSSIECLHLKSLSH